MANKEALRELQTRLAERLKTVRAEVPGVSWLAVECAGRGFLLPLHEAGGRVAGAVMTLHAPSRMGGRMSALQNYDAGGFEAILGSSPEIVQLKQRAARMAIVDAPLLITGESSTSVLFGPPLKCVVTVSVMLATAPPLGVP